TGAAAVSRKNVTNSRNTTPATTAGTSQNHAHDVPASARLISSARALTKFPSSTPTPDAVKASIPWALARKRLGAWRSTHTLVTTKKNVKQMPCSGNPTSAMNGREPVAKIALRTTHPSTASASVTLNPSRARTTGNEARQTTSDTWARVWSAIGL